MSVCLGLLYFCVFALFGVVLIHFALGLTLPILFYLFFCCVGVDVYVGSYFVSFRLEFCCGRVMCCAGSFHVHLFSFLGLCGVAFFVDLICKVLCVAAVCCCVVDLCVVFVCSSGLVCRAVRCYVLKCVALVCF